MYIPYNTVLSLQFTKEMRVPSVREPDGFTIILTATQLVKWKLNMVKSHGNLHMILTDATDTWVVSQDVSVTDDQADYWEYVGRYMVNKEEAMK